MSDISPLAVEKLNKLWRHQICLRYLSVTYLSVTVKTLILAGSLTGRAGRLKKKVLRSLILDRSDDRIISQPPTYSSWEGSGWRNFFKSFWHHSFIDLPDSGSRHCSVGIFRMIQNSLLVGTVCLNPLYLIITLIIFQSSKLVSNFGTH